MAQELQIGLKGISEEAIGGTIDKEEVEAVGAPPARVGFWVFIAGEVIILLSLIASAIYFRLTYPHWHETSTFTNVVISTINTFILPIQILSGCSTIPLPGSTACTSLPAPVSSLGCGSMCAKRKASTQWKMLLYTGIS